MRCLSLMITLLVSTPVFSQVADKQFPEDQRIYKPGKDMGFDQFKTKSLFGTKKVVLTFDDGPDTVNTPRLLNILKKYNVKATFFMLSEKFNAKTLPMIKEVAAQGHIVASHHHDHENNNAKDEATYKAGLKESI